MPIIDTPVGLFATAGNAPLETTVCVIGSGFGGALVAVALAAAGIDVLLLESGSSEPDHRKDAMLDQVHVSGRTELNFGFARQLGGASNLWGGRVAPLEAIDFAPRPWVPLSGWPISLDDLEPYYVRAGAILGIPGYRSFLERNHTRPDFLSTDRIDLKSFQWAHTPFNAGAYLKAQSSPSLKVVMNAPVVQLVERANAGSIESAMIRLPQGKTALVHANVFVIAAGGIQTPRLLLHSRAVRAEGVGGAHGTVGRYLSTHPKANLATLTLNTPVSTRHPLFTDHQPLPGGVMRYGAGFNAASQQEFRLLNHYVQFLPYLESRANRFFDAFRESSALGQLRVGRSRIIDEWLPRIGKTAFEIMGRLGGVQRRAGKFILKAFLDQYPNPDNRITLSEKRDEHGMALANVNWSFSGRDRTSVIDFFRRLDQELQSRGRSRLDYGGLEASDDWPLVGIHSHFLGTTRMGDDPRTSATTKDCRIHGSDNVYVSGPSLFPTYGYANPAYTISALALRLADHVTGRLRQ
jgi:choline dehydrogenase-like flavoprotein